MKIAVIGTGMVGRALAARLAGIGHDVVIGTRDVAATLARTEHDTFGNPAYPQWQLEHSAVRLATFADAGAHGEIVINASNGQNALAALAEVGSDNLSGKILLDAALPLDLSHGFPPTMTIVNTDSLGEQIQRAFPAARVVKSLNTVFVEVMVDPSRVPGDHTIFVAGDDAAAKQAVGGILMSFGWPEDSILDLGGIAAARGVEMYSRLFFDLQQAWGTFDFNIKVVRAAQGA